MYKCISEHLSETRLSTWTERSVEQVSRHAVRPGDVDPCTAARYTSLSCAYNAKEGMHYKIREEFLGVFEVLLGGQTQLEVLRLVEYANE